MLSIESIVKNGTQAGNKFIVNMIRRLFKKIKNAIVYLVDPGHYHCRVKILQNKGMIIGDNVSLLHGTIIDSSRPWLIEIGSNVTFAPRCHVLTHDASMNLFINKTKIGKVRIFDNVFFGAGTVILPSVTIGPNAIVGAGSVVTNDVPENSVYAGNSARFICTLDDFLKKHKRLSKEHPSYPYPEFHEKCITDDNIEKMSDELNNTFGYSVGRGKNDDSD